MELTSALEKYGHTIYLEFVLLWNFKNTLSLVINVFLEDLFSMIILPNKFKNDSTDEFRTERYLYKDSESWSTKLQPLGGCPIFSTLSFPELTVRNLYTWNTCWKLLFWGDSSVDYLKNIHHWFPEHLGIFEYNVKLPLLVW